MRVNLSYKQARGLCEWPGKECGRSIKWRKEEFGAVYEAYRRCIGIDPEFVMFRLHCFQSFPPQNSIQMIRYFVYKESVSWTQLRK